MKLTSDMIGLEHGISATVASQMRLTYGMSTKYIFDDIIS